MMDFETENNNKPDLDAEITELEELHHTATELFKLAEEGWQDVRENALADNDFYNGNQWDSDLIAVAKLKKEPTLTVNRLPTFVKQIENELRQREMTINVNSTDAVGSEKTAEVFAGIIRAIEKDSHAKSHYIHAAGENGALVGGFGFLKVNVDYVSREGFDQKITISSVKDPMKIIPDPSALEPDMSDAQYWFEVEDYPEAVFKRNWPQAECRSVDMFPVGASESNWIVGDSIRVARFWYKEEQVVTRYMMDDGSVVTENSVQGYTHDGDNDDIHEDDMTEVQLALKEGKVILRSRNVVECVIRWVDFNGAEILDQGDFAGDFLPFVAVCGPTSIVDGVRDIRGLIRNAKDSQRMLNYMASSAARRIASANKSPWIVDASSIAQYKKYWENTNTENFPFLPYDSTDANNQGKPLPAPQRADQTGQIQDLLMAAEKFENDLRSTMGIFDAGIGNAQGDRQSGVAISRLGDQGRSGNYHFTDSLTRSIEQVGRILINLIPKIYDTPRAIRTMNAQGEQEVVMINQIFEQNGKAELYNLSEGDFDVAIDIGPGFASAKQEAIEKLIALGQMYPNMLPAVADIIASNLDYAGKEVVQKRLLKLGISQMPTVFADDDEQLPPQAIAQLEEMKAQLQALTDQSKALQEQNQQLTFEKQAKTLEHQNSMAKLERQAENDRMRLEMEAANDEKQEEMRAYREALLAEEKNSLTEMKIRSDSAQRSAQLTQSTVKDHGTQADEVLADVLPKVDAMVDRTVTTE